MTLEEFLKTNTDIHITSGAAGLAELERLFCFSFIQIEDEKYRKLLELESKLDEAIEKLNDVRKAKITGV